VLICTFYFDYNNLFIFRNDLEYYAIKVILDNVVINNITYSYYKNYLFIFNGWVYSLKNISITNINNKDLVLDDSLSSSYEYEFKLFKMYVELD
jgi:hypothetical protein